MILIPKTPHWRRPGQRSSTRALL